MPGRVVIVPRIAPATRRNTGANTDTTRKIETRRESSLTEKTMLCNYPELMTEERPEPVNLAETPQSNPQPIPFPQWKTLAALTTSFSNS